MNSAATHGFLVNLWIYGVPGIAVVGTTYLYGRVLLRCVKRARESWSEARSSTAFAEFEADFDQRIRAFYRLFVILHVISTALVAGWMFPVGYLIALLSVSACTIYGLALLVLIVPHLRSTALLILPGPAIMACAAVLFGGLLSLVTQNGANGRSVMYLALLFCGWTALAPVMLKLAWNIAQRRNASWLGI